MANGETAVNGTNGETDKNSFSAVKAEKVGFKNWLADHKKKSEDERNSHFAKFETDTQFPEFKGWESIGFHRPIANELWEIILELINNVLYIFMLAYLVPILNPFPEIEGYKGLAYGLFYTIYVIFDTGTNFGLGRFIAEYRIKNPAKMMEYVNFFIRYQLITGLIQVTVLSFYVLKVVVYGQYAYLVWILLLDMHKQYPGMLNIFKDIIGGMQYFSMTQIMNWFQSKGLEFFLNIGFILMGRAFGEANPQFGIIMGMAIFGVIGNYIDDLIMLPVSAMYLNRIMKKHMGYSLGKALRFKVGKDVYRNAIRYGVPGSILPIITSAVNTFILLAYSTNIPGYITWSALAGFGSNFASIMGQFGDFSLSTNIAESYPSGKKTLAEFYVSYSLRWRFFFRMLFFMAIIAAIPYLYLMVESNPGLQWYLPGFIFLMPNLIKSLFSPFLELADAIMYGSEKINEYQIIRAIEEVLKLFFIWLFIFAIRVQDHWGMVGIIFLFIFQNYIPYVIKTVLCYVFIQKKVLNIKVYWMPTMIIPFICALPALLFARVWLVTAFPYMMAALGFNLSSTICYILFFFILLFTYFPLTMLLGGWDDYQLFMFMKAVLLSGPSKMIFVPVYLLLEKCAKVARRLKTHGKYPIPYKEAHAQILELMAIKKQHLEDQKNNA